MIAGEICKWKMANLTDVNLEIAIVWNTESWPWHWTQVLLVFLKGIRFKMKEGLQTTGQDIGKVQQNGVKSLMISTFILTTFLW